MFFNTLIFDQRVKINVLNYVIVILVQSIKITFIIVVSFAYEALFLKKKNEIIHIIYLMPTFIV